MDMLTNQNVKFLIVHCSDTENKLSLQAIDIHKMHLNFGWNGILYKIILRSGKIETAT